MKKGFTLLEVLIAIFILALMSLMIWQITNNTYRGIDKAGVYNSIYQYGRISLKKMSDDFSQAFLVGPSLQGKLSDGSPAIKTSFIGEDEGDRDMVNFVSFSGTRFMKNEKKTEQIEVGYYVADCPDTPEEESCLMRRESNVVDTNEKEGGEAFPVAIGVKKFNVQYYDTNKQEWRADWNSIDPAFLNKLPRAVKMTLVFPDPKKKDEEIIFEDSVLVPMSTGALEF